MSRALCVSEAGVEPIEPVSHGEPRSVQQHPHIAFGNAKQRTDLARLKLLLATKDQNGALRRRQGFDDRFDMLEDTPTFDMALGGQVFPELGEVAPVTAPVEGIGQPVAVALVVEEDGSALAPRPAAGLVDEDGIDPAGQRSSPFEEIDPAKHGDPGILDDLLGTGPGLHHAGAKADHRRIVLSKEPLESDRIPLDQAQHKGALVVLNLPHAFSRSRPGAISKTFTMNVQPHSAPSSLSDHGDLVARCGLILQPASLRFGGSA